MRWVRDATGRLPERPHYEPAEIDAECEALVGGFLRARYGAAAYPLTTNDLTVLVESRVGDLDLYADFGAEDALAEGVTEFRSGQAPRVRIAARLAEAPDREHRLRTTLAHELGHVTLHSFLWASTARLRAGSGPRPATTPEVQAPIRCRRQTMLGTGSDWLEWQAGYACGAFLMPAGAVARLIAGSEGDSGATRPAQCVSQDSPEGRARVRRVQRAFLVSSAAARLRLTRLGYLVSPVRRAR